MTRRALKRLLWILAGVAVLYAFLTTFVAQVRYVDSSSMEPTIFGSEENGESVLVSLDGDLPERFDIVVLHSPDTGLIVKRVWGLPGEEVAIRNGDFFVEDSFLPSDAERPPLITVFDERWHELDRYFVVEDTVWSKDGDHWVVAAESVEPRSEAGTIFLHKKVRDSYLDRDQRSIEGTRVVNDLEVRLELRFEEWIPNSAFQIDLREWGDSFEAVIEPLDEERCRLSIYRDNSELRRELLARREVSMAAREWHSFDFSNVDNQLRATIDRGSPEAQTLEADYDTNVFDPFDDRHLGKTLAHQVQLGACLTRAHVRGVELRRDYFFTPRGKHAVATPELLQSDQLFVLGDNSSRSRDSREYGPIQLGNLYGRALRVVWPISSWRTLEPLEGR